MKRPALCCLTSFLAVFCPGTVRSDGPDKSGGPGSFTSWHSANGDMRLKLSGLLDIETYTLPSTAPGLIYSNDTFLFNPRLSLFLDGQAGRYLYFFTQARVDRGFDPSERGPQLRLDEYALRYTPWEDGRFNVQFGKFATVTGNYAGRHLSWDNPFISAPLVYENLTGIWDYYAVDTPATLLAWGHVPTPEYSDFGDGYYDKHERLPVVWGPAYASGISIAGKFRKFEYAAEMKNAGLSSRPQSWDANHVNFSHPAFSTRLGYRPNMAWNLGFSAAAGPYLRPEAESTLPPGEDIGDYRQITLGQDIGFEWHHLQLWAEAYWCRFEVPAVGDADTMGYYLEAKYKFTPQLFGALRWNQQFYSNIDYDGERIPWGRDIWRIDTAVGYRFTPYTQLKLQYGLQHERWADSDFEHLFATQFTAKF
jgi:hypothetical protein